MSGLNMKGQISLEAILAVGFSIVILLSLFNLTWERFYLARDVGEAGEAKMVGELLAGAINNAYADGDGFSIYLGAEILNYTRLSDTSRITGVGISLPIVIDKTGRTINISKSMQKTGGGNWETTIPIIPANISRADPTAQYTETTIRNSGGGIIIYAAQGNINVP